MKKWFGLLFLLLFIFGCNFELEQKGVIIDNMVIKESGNMNGPTRGVLYTKHSVSFNIENFNSSIADCYAKIWLNDEIEYRDIIGIVKAKSKEKKQFDLTLEKNQVQVKVEPVCIWIDESIAKECGDEETYGDRRACELTIGKPRLKQCLSGDVTYYKFFCIALISKDPVLCDHIIPDSKRNWCKAYITKDVSLCENIQNGTARDWCYTDIGINFKDATICDNIIDKNSKTSCIAAAKLNPELCLEGLESYKVPCIVNIIESTGDKDLCELLDEQKEECIEQTK